MSSGLLFGSFYPVRSITGPCATAKLPLMRSPYSMGGADTLVGWVKRVEDPDSQGDVRSAHIRTDEL